MFSIYLGAILIGSVTLVSSTILAIHNGFWGNVIIYVVVYLLAVAITFLRRIPFGIRAWSGLAIFYTLGLLALLTGGPGGSGRLWLFAFSIAAGLILGLRVAIFTLILNAATLFISGWLMSTGLLEWPVITPSVRVWNVGSLTFVFLNTVVTIALAVLVRGLERSLKKEQALVSDLSSSNEQFRQEMEERKRIEEALRENERRYRLLAENVTDVIWTLDIETLGYTYISPSVTALQGYTPEEAMAKSVEELLTPDSLESAMNELAGGLDPKNMGPDGSIWTRTIEAEIRHKDGSTFWGELQITFIPDPDGRPRELLGITRDITERRKASEALKESEERYRKLFDSSVVGMLVQQDGVFRLVNKWIIEKSGYSEEELLGKPVYDLMHTDDVKRAQEVRTQRMLGQSPDGSSQYRIKTKDGEIRWVELLGATIDYQGKPAVFNSLIDITETKQAEEERLELRTRLERAQRMESLGVLAGGVAHDLNNILVPVLGYPELIMLNLPEDSRIQGYAQEIKSSAERAAEVVQDLLALGRRGRYEMKPLNLNQVLGSYLNSLDFTNLKERNPNVAVEIELDTELLNISGSSSHLAKTIMNLTINAFDALPHGGNLRMATACEYIDKSFGGYDQVEEGDYVVLRISDTGAGIEEEDLQRIFEPFYTKKKMGRSGSGLGLSVVYGVVKDLNGYIDVRTRIGVGTEFLLYFPVTREELQEEPDVSFDMRGNEKVLLVDDVEQQRKVAASMLSALGYAVETAANGRAAVEYLKEKQADIVVLDMIMEDGFDGLDTYRKIVTMLPGQKAIIVSGFSETGRVRQAQKLGAGQYVSKPYTLEKIGRAIRQELDRKRDSN